MSHLKYPQHLVSYTYVCTVYYIVQKSGGVKLGKSIIIEFWESLNLQQFEEFAFNYFGKTGIFLGKILTNITFASPILQQSFHPSKFTLHIQCILLSLNTQ